MTYYWEFIHKNIECFIFPIVRRAFSNYKHLVVNCYKVASFIDNNISLMDDIECSNFDVEAEFCNIMAKEISDLKL